MENNFIAALIVHCLKKNRNISFEPVIDKNLFSQNMFEKYTHFWAKTRRKALRLPWTRRTKLSKVNTNQDKCED